MAEMYGKANGCSRGRGGSMHLFDVSRRFYGGHAIVGGGLPVAVGLALADALRRRAAVTACFFGDGAVAEGAFHESLNLAALWRLPVLFLCENNLYAMGTALDAPPGQTDIVRKAEAHGVPARPWTAWTCSPSRRRRGGRPRPCAAGEGPRLLEARTYRFRAHSMYDPELYRAKDEVERWKARDPIARFAAALREPGPPRRRRPGSRSRRTWPPRSSAAVAEAEAGPWEPVEDLLEGRLHAGGADDEDDLSRGGAERAARGAARATRACS